jgi:hypothetical protein
MKKMKKITLALMLVFGCCGLGLAQKSAQATEQEKKDIFQLILKDKTVSEDLENKAFDEKALFDSISIEKKDLNKDGKPEYIGKSDLSISCGAHSNCPEWVFGRTTDGYRLLLATHAQKVTIQKTLSNKFYDIRAEGSDSAVESSYSIYKFDGNVYKATDCFTVNNEGKKPKTTRIKCEE